MPDNTNDWVRVLDTDTGHERSVRTSELRHGNYEVREDVDALDELGNPQAPVYKDAAPAEDTPPTYDKRLKAELEAEIAARNAGRVEDDHITASGTKAELAAALVADDADHPEFDNSGLQADPQKES